MALGLIFAKKTLKKGCSPEPNSCACKKESEKQRCRDAENKNHV